jgi:hypothetical protein
MWLRSETPRVLEMLLRCRELIDFPLDFRRDVAIDIWRNGQESACINGNV